jgi:hypothetical protein
MMKRYFYIPFLVIVVSSCNIFQTRTPQLPQQGQSNFTPPQLPSIVIQNLQNAIAEKYLDGYLWCLSDTASGNYGGKEFSFEPPSDVFSNYSSVFQGWNRNSESLYFNNFVNYSSSSASPVLTLFNENYVSLSSDSVEYSYDYDLEWPNTLQGFGRSYQGYLQFILVQDDHGNWAIRKWIDSHTSDTLTTWSELKARLYSK